MKLVILAVGKLKDKRILSMAEEYLQRLRPAGIVSVGHVPDVANGSSEERMEREGQELLKRIRPRDRLLLLGEDEKEYDSREFAALLAQEMKITAGRVVFVIGGPWGTSGTVRQRADKGLALSRMTFTHEMCFLFLTEQLYRAFSILQGSGYHH